LIVFPEQGRQHLYAANMSEPGIESHVWVTFDEDERALDGATRPEFADLGRYGRRILRRFVAQARADERPSFERIVGDHLGVPPRDLPVVEERWAPYEHVNVQAALDVWLHEAGRTAETVGMTNYRHRGPFGLGDLISPDEGDMYGHGPRPGNISRVAKPTGPDGETLECLRAAIILVSEGEDRIALLYRGSDRESDMYGVTIEAVANRSDLAARTTGRLRELAHEHNVYRGQVVSFGHDMFDDHDDSPRRGGRSEPGAVACLGPASETWPSALWSAGGRKDAHRSLPHRRAA
jgi:hypothetical protein